MQHGNEGPMIFQRLVSGRPRQLAQFSVGVLIAHFLSPAMALAQEEDPSAVETAAARSLAVEGVKFAQSGECSPAVDRLERAAKLRQSPVVLWYLGDCQIKLGRWVEGSESLRKLLREPLPADPTPAIQQAYGKAAETLKALKPQIPSLTILVKGQRDSKVNVTLDGTAFSDTVLGAAIPANPGSHTIEVDAQGFLKASASLRLEPGSRETVTLILTPDPAAIPAREQSPTKEAVVPPTNEPAEDLGRDSHSAIATDSAPSRLSSYLAFGAGAVGLAVGVGFGRAAMQDETRLSERCPSRICGPEARDDLDAAKTKGTISTVGFAVGAVGVTLGTVLFFSAGSGSRTETGSVKSSSSRVAFQPKARIGLGSVHLSTDF